MKTEEHLKVYTRVSTKQLGFEAKGSRKFLPDVNKSDDKKTDVSIGVMKSTEAFSSTLSVI